jgi:kinetochor protein Mis14/NSL1
MADVHRKIELQEQDDLRYLINNARRRANERIDLALPPIEGEDALRRRVEELVHEVRFLSHRFNFLELAHPSRCPKQVSRLT